MNNYKITFNKKHNGDIRAKNAGNALVKFIRILSATHVIKRGTIANAKRNNPSDSYASVYMWTGSYNQPVFIIAEQVLE